ncbi:non-specific lipid-transfer protein 1-like [Tripterygium wilfordii]|uniref:non-specific lipid-transfer protein 1-like n=1 Tax=Tripterygium wilfordii TaxID=458696 RepID=UPI0018F81243|nr:non-specific lipid-transfer protein 1-like [Tripterygium wilfordii]
MARSICIVFLVIFGMRAANVVQAISCTQSLLSLLPCLPFFTTPIPMPSVQCCVAVASLNLEANTKEIRQELCNCFKSAFTSYGVLPEKAKQVPQLCNVPVPVPIDPNIDCNTIN